VEILTGTVLVLFTWSLLALIVMAAGAGFSLLSTDQRKLNTAVVRRSLWWGLAIFVLFILIASLLYPLRSSASLVFVVSLSALVVIFSAVTIARRRIHSGGALKKRTRNWVSALALFVIACVAVLVAIRALGPANNYDTGLYHLGAINYAGDFSTVPGLANLLNAFGYSNSIFPSAAFLGNGPWDGNGYRLLNGFVLFLVLIDLALRVLNRSRSVGTYGLIIGTTGMLLPLIAVTDFWVTSPTSDSAVMLLTLVGSAYFVDFVATRKNMVANSAIVILTLTLVISMRPTMLIFAGTTAILTVVLLIHRRNSLIPSALSWAATGVGVIAAVMGVISVVRDYLLSGWLLYPLSIYPFDVDWRAADPIYLREATLANARDPLAAEYWPVAHSWNWIDEWFIARWSMWETYFVIIGFAVLILGAVVAKRMGQRVRVRALVVSVIPSVVAVIAWFTLSPPSYRFIWGPLFLTFMIPLAFVLHAIKRDWVQPLLLIAMVGVLGGVSLYTALFRVPYSELTQRGDWRVGPVAITYRYAPAPVPATNSFVTTGGLEFVSPEVGEQCWGAYPLCAVNVGQTVSPRGESIQDGFLP
jgi:hypothetical protein